MALKDQTVNLILRAKNLISGDTKAASRSVEELAGNADALKGKLRELEDSSGLVRQFAAAEKAVDRTSAAYDRARLRADKLADKIGESGVVTERQAQEFAAAQKAVDAAEREYRKAEKTLGELGEEADAAGVDLADLNNEQRRLAEETKQAKRALSDLNAETSKADGRFLSFRKNLSSGVVTFGKWATAAAAAGAALTVGALTRFTASQADLARQTLASSAAFDVSAEKLQEWQYAANEVGIGGEKVADIMKDVSEKIGDAFLNGGGEALEVIKGLNLDIEKLVRLKPDEQILAISEKLDGLPKAGQIQVLEALASDASLLLPLLDNNAAKLRELSDEAQQRGAIFSEEELQQLAEVDSGFRKIVASIKGFGKEIVVKLAPSFKKLADTIDDALADKPALVDSISSAFVSLIETTGEWVSYIVEKRDEIGNSFSGIGNTIEGMRQLLIAAYRGVQAFGAGTSEVVARAVYDWKRAALAIVEFRNKVGLATDEAVQKAQFAVENAATSVRDLQAQSEGYKQQMIAAGNAAATAFAKARDGAIDAAGQVAKTVGELADLENAADDTGRSLDTLAEKVSALSKEEAALVGNIEEIATALEAAGAAYAEDGTPEQAAEVQRLNEQYSEQIQRLRQVREELHNLQNPVNGSEAPSGGAGGGLVDKWREANEVITETGDTAEETGKKTKQAGKEVEDAGKKVEETGKKAKQAAEDTGAGFTAIFAGVISYMENLSARAAQAFNRALGGRRTEIGSALEQRLERVNALLTYTQNRVTNGGVGNTLNKWAEAAYSTEKRFLEQSIAVEKLTDKIAAGDRNMRELSWSSDDVLQNFDLLDEHQLRPLIGAIQSAQREVESLNESLEDTIASLRQELAALEGDQAEVERLRYQERRLELEETLNRARETGDRDAIANAEEALRLTEKAYQKKVERVEAAAEAERKADADRAAREEERRQRDEAEERQDITREERRTQTQVTQLDRAASAPRTVRLDFSSNGRSFGSIEAIDDAAIDRIIDRLQDAGLVITG